jgi:hypothetical protein
MMRSTSDSARAGSGWVPIGAVGGSLTAVSSTSVTAVISMPAPTTPRRSSRVDRMIALSPSSRLACASASRIVAALYLDTLTLRSPARRSRCA